MRNKHDTMTMLDFEHENLNNGVKLIAGVDEVGRGPLAGPVVVACAMMPLNDEDIIQGVNDSKKLSEKKRETLYEEIIKKAISYRIESMSPKEIDEINILNATKTCMKRSIENMPIKPELVLIDAVEINTSVKTQSIIKGDAKSYSIACASILAKVYRDRLMREYDSQYPEYGFMSNKGYGSAKHIEAIKKIGPCEIHRRSFIKNFWTEK